MLISLSITRIAECICARMALDSANRNFELPLVPGRSKNAELRRLIADIAADVVAALGRKVASTNVGRINASTDDLIKLELNASHHQSVVVNARINLETAIVARVLAQLASKHGVDAARWYASLARATNSSGRLRG